MSRTALAAFAAIVLATACGADDRELAGYTLDPPPHVAVAPLPDLTQHGAPFDLHGPDGGLLLVYFGYTNCPDVCPATLTAVAAALDELGDDADRVEVAMVTVDPARDLDVLAPYVQAFVPGAHALGTADDAALSEVADAFGVGYEVTTEAGHTHVGHTDPLFAVDDTGSLALTWMAGTPSDDLAADLEQVLGHLA